MHGMQTTLFLSIEAEVCTNYFLEDFQEFALPTNICTTDFPNQLSSTLIHNIID